MRSIHIGPDNGGRDLPLHPFDVVVRRHYSPKLHFLGVYAVNEWHAMELARQLLWVRGPLVHIVDVQNQQERDVDGEWVPCKN